MTEPSEPFTLPRPEYNASSWLRDGVHCPRPLPATVGDTVTEWFSLVMGRPVVVVNGYLYMGMGPGVPTAGFEQAPESNPADAWYNFYVPRVVAVADWVEHRDWDALEPAAIVAALPDAFAALASAFASTMAPLVGLGGELGRLIAFCERYFGDGERQAAMLLSGSENATSAIGDTIAALANRARLHPALAAAVRAHDLAPLVDFEEGRAWLADFDHFLAEYGRGNETWFEFHHAAWVEDPTVPLAMIARVLAAPPGAPERPAALRESAIAAAKRSLPGEAERAQLDELLDLNSRYVAVIEDRARLQLRLAAAPRAPFLALGRKLAARGILANPDDVFHTGLTALRSSAAGKPTPLTDAATANRAALERWAALTPPESLGLPLPPGIERIAPLRQQFGVGAPAHEPGTLHGNGAGGGSVTAVARVIEGLDDADRLQPGEVLVCRNTAPPWTPLFAVAAAVVTEAGGVLSHTAIAAREYGIPAVVGVRGAIRLIADGATITVDGDAGTVHLRAAPL